MSMVDVGPVIFGSTYNLNQYMQTHGLLASSMVCQNCGVAMTLQARSVCSDEHSWRCPDCYTSRVYEVEAFFKVSIAIVKVAEAVVTRESSN